MCRLQWGLSGFSHSREVGYQRDGTRAGLQWGMGDVVVDVSCLVDSLLPFSPVAKNFNSCSSQGEDKLLCCCRVRASHHLVDTAALSALASRPWPGWALGLDCHHWHTISSGLMQHGPGQKVLTLWTISIYLRRTYSIVTSFHVPGRSVLWQWHGSLDFWPFDFPHAFPKLFYSYSVFPTSHLLLWFLM